MNVIKTFEDLEPEYYVCGQPVTDEQMNKGIFQYVHGSYATIEEAERMARKVREFYSASTRVECIITDAMPSGAKLYLDPRIPNDDNNLLKKRHGENV